MDTLSLTSRIIPLVPSQALKDGRYYGGMDVSGLLSVIMNRRVAQLDTAQYGMLLARYTDTNRQSTPPAEFCPHLELLAELSGWQIWNIMYIGAVIYWLASDKPLVRRLS